MVNRVLKTDALGLALRCGWEPRLEANASEHARQTCEQERDAVSFAGGVSLTEIIRRAADQDGLNTRDLREILTLTGANKERGAVVEVLSKAMHYGIAHIFGTTPDPTTGLVSEADLPDFRLAGRAVLMGERLEPLPDGGEAAECSFPVTLEKTRLMRYGRQFFLDQQVIEGDDVGFLKAAIESLTRSAKIIRGDLVFATLLANPTLTADSLALFEAGTHLNLGTGALDKTSLAAGFKAISEQRVNGVPLNLRGKVLVVPPSLEWTARELIHTVQIQNSPDLEIGLVVDARISAAGVTDSRTGVLYPGSDTNWFLFADPLQAPVIELQFLIGANRMPTVDNWIPRSGQYGLGFKVKYDLGATALDFHGVYKSTGAGA